MVEVLGNKNGRSLNILELSWKSEKLSARRGFLGREVVLVWGFGDFLKFS